MDNDKLTLEKLEELKEAMKKIDPNNEIFVKGNKEIEKRLDALREEQATKEK